MRYSLCRAAVFTPAMPHLEAFLKRHSRHDHPLHHHPLWLSDDDLLQLGNISLDKKGQVDGSSRGTDSPLPTVLAETQRTLFLYNMDQLPSECEVRWQFPPVAVPTSVSSLTEYKLRTREILEDARRDMGYESNWWGTKVAWANKGVQVGIGMLPTPVPTLHISQLLHISFLTNGDHILKNSYISGKTGSLKSWASQTETSPAYECFQERVKDHVRTHNFLSPLYFSEPALRTAGIPIRPGAKPLDLYDIQHSNGHIGTRKLALQQLTTAYQQYYHLSQLIFPDGYRIPQYVIEAELQSPGTPIHGASGRLLNVPELRPEAIVNSTAPELLPFLVQSNIGKSDDVSNSVTHLPGLESPQLVYGRNLWYLPQDVLDVGGMIDPNAMPVEVAVGNHAEKKRRELYNVEQLVIPLDGYRAVGCIATMNRFAQSSRTSPSGQLEEGDLQHPSVCPAQRCS